VGCEPTIAQVRCRRSGSTGGPVGLCSTGLVILADEPTGNSIGSPRKRCSQRCQRLPIKVVISTTIQSSWTVATLFWRSERGPSNATYGPRSLDLALEAGRTAVNQPVGSVVTALIVAAACAVILATTAARMSRKDVLPRIDDAGSRTIVVTDVQGSGGITPDAVERISRLSAAEWAVGFAGRRQKRGFRVRGARDGLTGRCSRLYGQLPVPPARLLGVNHDPALVGMMPIFWA